MKISISGIRGIFGNDFGPANILQFTTNFSSIIKSGKCVIGRDTRPSGEIIMNYVTAALMQSGIDVYNLGIVPTPIVFREARKFGSGIMITSSHNPIEWNGLKFILNGRGINAEELNVISGKQEILSSKIGNEEFIKSEYISDAAKIVGDVKNNPKVTIDIGGGAAKNFAQPLLEKIGCQVDAINEDLLESSRGMIKTQRQWESRKREIRRRWLRYLSPAIKNRGAAPTYEVIKEDTTDGVIRQLIRYEVEPGEVVDAYLLRPVEPVKNAPGVVVFHSTVNHSIRQPAGVEGVKEKAFGLALAKQGFIAICPRNYLWTNITSCYMFACP